MSSPCLALTRSGFSAGVLFFAAAGVAAQEPVLVTPFEVTPDGVVERPVEESGEEPSEAPEISRSRTLERVNWRCESDLLHSELTLFANGTLRLRHSPGTAERLVEPTSPLDWRVRDGRSRPSGSDGLNDADRPTMWLRELRPDVMDAYVRRLSEPSRAETPTRTATVTGDWLADCALRLELPGREPEIYSFGARDVLSLDLERTVGIVRELERLFHDDPRPPEGIRELAHDYRAERGDVLLRHDGVVFEVQGFTADGAGVELLGIDHPLTLYLRPEEVLEQFRAKVPRWVRDRR